MSSPIQALAAVHWRELQASAIAANVAALNVASYGPGTARHWEEERAALVVHARLQIQTGSVTLRGRPQIQPGHLSERLGRLDRRYRHLQSGGWRSLSAGLPGLPVFNQWKPQTPRVRTDRPGRPIKYEAPPAFPDGGGLLLPHIPERYWRLICERQGLASPADCTGGFWAWALATPELQLLICEGWKKALAVVSAGWAAVALPGVQMGRRRNADGSERLIAALQALATPGRRWLIVFDAEARPATARLVNSAAGALARSLRAAAGRVEIAHLPLLPGTDKTGLDDLIAADGPQALARALVAVGPKPVLPRLRTADRIAPAGAWLGVSCPIPAPPQAPLVVIRAPMGAGKTQAAAAALTPLAAEGTAILMPSHRQALGQAAAQSLGVPWCPAPGSDERLQGVAGCWDSWCLESALRISPSGWSGGVMVLDEWMQALEHLLLSSGTALASCRASVLRTAAEHLARMLQTIAMDAQMADWGVHLLERLSGQRALVLASEHRPMLGRPLHSPEGLRTPEAAADAFRARWAHLVAAGQPFLCWTSAQQAGMSNAAQTLAALHRQRVPQARLLVVDSTTPEAAAELAADPDGVAERYDAIYCTPAISSGISFQCWRPAAVIAYAGGRIAPEHVAQALARVRSPQVPAYLFAPERCPGAALRVGSGATDPDRLIRDLQAVADPLFGELEAAGAEGAWLQAWAELGAHRNRQRYAYQATICGLLEREGWQLQAPDSAACPAAGARVAADLRQIAEAARAAADQAVIQAAPITDREAAELARRRRLQPSEQACLERHRLARRWGLEGAPPSLALIEAERDELRERLQLGWLLTTPQAAALVPEHDWRALEALDATGRPFAPDRPRVTLGVALSAFTAVGLPALLRRFAAGEAIAAHDPAVLALHATATAHRHQLIAATGWSPGVKASGTLRALLKAIGWTLQSAGRIKTRGAGRDAYTYRAAPQALPDGVDAEKLAAAWLAALQEQPAVGAKSRPTRFCCRAENSPTPEVPHRLPRPMAGCRVLLQALTPKRPCGPGRLPSVAGSHSGPRPLTQSRACSQAEKARHHAHEDSATQVPPVLVLAAEQKAAEHRCSQ